MKSARPLYSSSWESMVATCSTVKWRRRAASPTCGVLHLLHLLGGVRVRETAADALLSHRPTGIGRPAPDECARSRVAEGGAQHELLVVVEHAMPARQAPVVPRRLERKPLHDELRAPRRLRT
eukprot:scaffold88976_cov36-Phaeocystis_antarctica.AAC.1